MLRLGRGVLVRQFGFIVPSDAMRPHCVFHSTNDKSDAPADYLAWLHEMTVQHELAKARSVEKGIPTRCPPLHIRDMPS
jgi:hypothetical protein